MIMAADVQRNSVAMDISIGAHKIKSSQPRQIPKTAALQIPPPSAIALPPPSSSINRIRNSYLALDSFSPVNQNGSFEFDRVLKCGYVEKRTRKTKAWKSIYLVLRANSLSIYKDQNEDKLRHKIQLGDLTAVAFLKDPKHKRENVFGLFSPSRNYHLEAKSRKDAEEWVELIRREARIEEEEEEMLLASPGGHATGIYTGFERSTRPRKDEAKRLHDERLGSSSPEPSDPQRPKSQGSVLRRMSHTFEYSGNELASHSDMSDAEAVRAPGASSVSIPEEPLAVKRPPLGAHNASQMSVSNLNHEASDPERVIWQGHLLYLRSKGGVRSWRDLWTVVRPRNIAFYKNDSEYSPILITPLSSILSAVEIDPLSRTKRFCLQLITEEKSYKLCARNEAELDKCLGAVKSLLAKRKEMRERER